jgi:hypothetical protein
MNFTLDAVQPANKEWKAQKILIYSVQVLGKTTFGSTFECEAHFLFLLFGFF